MKILQTLLILQFILTGAISIAGELEETIKFTDPIMQKNLKEALSERNIAFRVDEEGTIWYSNSSRSEVHEVENSITRKYFPGNAVSINDDEYLEILKRRFEEEQIEFKVIELSNKTKIAWGDIHNEKARMVLREISDSFAQKHYEQLLKERKNSK